MGRVAVDDEENQVTRIEVVAVGVHVSGADVGDEMRGYNSCCELTARKLAWIRSI